MLLELYVREFAIIDELRIAFLPGFNVLTGETGAGKSIILDAMTLVLGERADTSLIRSGSDSAYVEATFQLDLKEPTSSSAMVKELLVNEGLDTPEEILVLAREVRVNGRNTCRINGQAVNLNLLRAFGSLLVDIHGQGEHLSLLKPAAHLPLLDAFGQIESERETVATLVDEVMGIQRQLRSLQSDRRSRAQRIDMLHYQVTEIDAANLISGEEDDLRSERSRLANAEQLIEHAGEALALLNGERDETPAVADMLGQIERSVLQLTKLDDSLSAMLEQVQALTYQVSDLVGELISYQENLDFVPGRLSFLEERLELIGQLKRKYGDSIDAILLWRDNAEKELDSIGGDQDRAKELQATEERYLQKIGKLASELSLKRQEAALMLSSAVEGELADLNMANARFEVAFSTEEKSDGAYVGEKRLAFDRSGIDRAEYLLSANPGENLKPLAKVASGGETSRIMLALKTALAQVDATPTLIFDEIDQGIGGRVGEVVGRKLWGLTNPARHQVIVVTHLPQLAGFGDAHFHVDKQVVKGRTVTIVSKLDPEDRIKELAAMLGTRGTSATGGAKAILAQAEKEKLPIS